MMNRYGENVLPCLVPDIRGKASLSFIIKCGCFIHALYQVEEVPISSLFLFFLIMKGFWILSIAFSALLR